MGKVRVEVAVPLGAPQTFTYYQDCGEGTVAQPGCRALVPFGRRHLVGMVVEVSPGPPGEGIRPVRTILDPHPLLDPTLLSLARWISDYYLAPPGEVLRAMLPGGLLLKQASPDREPEAFWPARTQAAVVEVQAVDPPGLTPRRRSVLATLREQRLPVLVRDLVREELAGSAILRELERQGAIRIEAIDIWRSPWSAPVAEGVRHPLNEEQRRVLATAIGRLGQGFSSGLVHGVTASGKTEVYLNLIDAVLKLDRTALVLVPEIGLTPQMARQFRGWFGSRVAILHSALSDGERFDQWRRIRAGELPVVVGTRSAVFAPLQNLGLIIVDEEHDASYKQAETPRYHGRDTALKRGQLCDAFVLLGSATPQLETWHASLFRKLHVYLPMRSRIQARPLPVVHIVDMRVEFQKAGKSAVISELLRKLIRDRLSRREQVLILLNRRGYSRFLLCRSCGYVATCVSCSISLTFHQEFNRLSCHYCGYARSVPAACPECEKPFLYYVGEGTEQIEELLRSDFPSASIGRLDRDTVQRRGSLDRILEAFAAGRTEILVGTQMIAKGHDFPAVTLVGVLGADLGLKLADFRAAERTFQLLTQVAGRAGRGDRPGEVVIQTYFPNHYSLRHACTQEYEPFSLQELDFRRKFRYPPLTALANLLVRDRDSRRAWQLARDLADTLRTVAGTGDLAREVRVLGPAPAAIEKIKDDFRIQVLVKSTSRRALNRVLTESVGRLRRNRQNLSRIAIDVDPVNLM